SRRQINRDLFHLRGSQVIDHDVVSAAERCELNPLDAGEIHGDAGDIAGKLRVRALGRDGDVFADIGTIEHERVEAGPAIDHVAAVARVPDERVVAVTELRRVAAAIDQVVTATADEKV